MHIKETRFTRGIVIGTERGGWCFAVLDSTPAMKGLNATLYGRWPWQPRYDNGARAMFFCWNAGAYRHWRA